MSVAGGLSEGLGGVGTEGLVPAPGIGGAVQVLPALSLTLRRASPGGGEGRGVGVVVEDDNMGGTGHGGVVPAPMRVDGGGRCGCTVALVRVRREMIGGIRMVREEMIMALALHLAGRGLGM